MFSQFFDLISKGFITIYLPTCNESLQCMLSCSKLGAPHNVVFSGFSSVALGERTSSCGSKVIITTTFSWRGEKKIELLENARKAIYEHKCGAEKIIVIEKLHCYGPEYEGNTIHEGAEPYVKNMTKNGVSWTEITYKKLPDDFIYQCPVKNVSEDDPLFVLFTSGSTGKPKGILHRRGGYLSYVKDTFKTVFDARPDDVYFCTADFGWITGHSYGVYGPVLNGVKTIIHSGVPTYPDPSIWWRIIDEHKVSIFYTSPTALRSLMKLGDEYLEKFSLDSLRVLATVGEPIDEVTWRWFYEKVGKKRCPIIDTWWQTESGGIMIYPHDMKKLKPGCAGRPFKGIEAVVMNQDGEVKTPMMKGDLCIKNRWDGLAMGILGDEEYFKNNYFSKYKGYYFTGDAAMFDDDGDFWILGRVDDVLNVSGHRLNAAEIEQAVMRQGNLAEVCVVGFPHKIKGQGIGVFVVKKHLEISLDDEHLIKEIVKSVRETIGAIASPDKIYIIDDIPKTRSGKIVRRLLRKIIANETVEHEDMSTLVNPQCLKEIVETMNQAEKISQAAS